MISSSNIFLAVACLFLVFTLVVVVLYYPRRLKQKLYQKDWKKIQALCKNKLTWPKALEEADKMLKKTLRKRRFKGKSMGEKMVSAQRLITDNDSLWYAHNLHKKVYAGQKKLKQSEVIDALVGYRQALRDLGALPKERRGKNG